MYREKSNGKDYFIKQVEDGQELDMIAVRMMEENSIQGIMPFRKVNTVEGTYFEYEIIGQETLETWFTMSHGKREVVSILNSLIQISDEVEANLMEADHLYAEKECVAVENGKCYLAYIPYVQYSNGGLMKLVEDIVYRVSVLQNENFDYIYDLRNAFSSDEIVSMTDLKKWLNNIQGQEAISQERIGQENLSALNPSFVKQQNSMQGQVPLQQSVVEDTNMWGKPNGMNQNANSASFIMPGDGQMVKDEKKAEKPPKKSIFGKKEKSLVSSTIPPQGVGGTFNLFDDFFDDVPKKKTPLQSVDMPNNMNIPQNVGMSNSVKMPNNIDVPQGVGGIDGVNIFNQQVGKADSSQQKSGRKLKMPSFGGKKQVKDLSNGGMMPPNGGMMPPNGRMQMPPNGGMMSPNGRMQMPPNGGMMPPNGRMQMPPNGGMMSPNGRMQMPPNGGMMPPNGRMQMPPNGRMQMPPNGRMQMPPNGGMMPPNGRMQMPPNGKIMNELEFENEATVIISNSSNSCRGSIKCKDFPDGFPLERESYLIGIGQQADIRITGNGTVSRKHARIYKQAGAFYIIDEGSLNGTFVNNRQLMANEPCKLENGAKIELSDETIMFEMR